MLKAKTLIEENNHKRKQLNKENKKYYEEMLVYIRLSYDKSEQETEEILTEMLDHLLEAQQGGRSAEDVFGNDPKKYADDIIGELPKMITKDRLLLGAMALLYFGAYSTIFLGLFSVIAHYVFGLDSLYREFYLGSVAIRALLSIPIAFLFMYFILLYLRWASFKNVNKVAEFFLFWLWGVASVGVFMLAIYFTPEIGPTMEVSAFYIILLGMLLLLAGRWTKNKGQ
ncbi:DUF1129 family protein [Evansella cellulosilytica]|uniref:DUF1129 family protein n=1 Tax=Evansella cellulosilytica (strain ATCC 21833 / DSM 2522 / FERM P-1141 / JCM 9156 / N-4) TaxID=649639 RepID=E6TQC6_EVAC2|nr:DUF1129 family protein [Evansella cellulosilytica]ADU29304.1 hypothetical protein Bcell_1031 [Evansella cellulosilytica DSM 2522]